MVALTLTYFAAPGRAEASRLAFRVGNIPFTDRRVSTDEFTKIRPELPFGSLPVLEVDGSTYAQSGAILRYAGHLAGLYPANDAAACLRIDQVLGACDDINQHIAAMLRMRDADAQAQARRDIINEHIPRYIGPLNNLVEGQYFTGDRITIADLEFYVLSRRLTDGSLDGIPSDVLQQYPNLVTLSQNVASHPRVPAWERSC